MVCLISNSQRINATINFNLNFNLTLGKTIFSFCREKIMGHLIFWAIVRTAILIPSLWLLYGMMEYKYWWWFAILSIYGVIIHPLVIQYRFFYEANKEIIENTLCSSCKYFDKTAVLCMKYDKHPTLEELPCEGNDWEPKENV